MKRILTLIFLLNAGISSAQFDVNIGGGINYNIGFFESGGGQSAYAVGKLAEVSVALREAEDWYYRLGIQGAENMWTSNFNRMTRQRDQTRYRYLNVIPQVEYLPGRALGFTGGLYFGILLDEKINFSNSNEWVESAPFPPTRKIDAGLMLGANLYLGSISIGLHYTRGVMSIKEEIQTDTFSSFRNVGQFNSGIQVKMGYFFSVGESEWE